MPKSPEAVEREIAELTAKQLGLRGWEVAAWGKLIEGMLAPEVPPEGYENEISELRENAGDDTNGYQVFDLLQGLAEENLPLILIKAGVVFPNEDLAGADVSGLRIDEVNLTPFVERLKQTRKFGR